MHGVLMAAGPNVRPGAVLKGTQIIDLAPTILYRMGVPVPDNMDGRVLTELFDPDFLSANPWAVKVAQPSGGQPEHSFQPEEEAEIEVRLRGLGYLG